MTTKRKLNAMEQRILIERRVTHSPNALTGQTGTGRTLSTTGTSGTPRGSGRQRERQLQKMANRTEIRKTMMTTTTANQRSRRTSAGTRRARRIGHPQKTPIDATVHIAYKIDSDSVKM